MAARIAWRVNGGVAHIEERDLGQVPVMVKVSCLTIVLGIERRSH